MYEILIEDSAEKDLLKLPQETVERILKHILPLEDNPRFPGTRKITGSRNDWRIRVGDYRVVYEILDERKIVRIFKIKHRKDVYR